MKNLFKKSIKKETTATIQKMDKNQLEKVIGGTDTEVTTTAVEASKNTPRYIVKADGIVY
jgi:hypothetical protein